MRSSDRANRARMAASLKSGRRLGDSTMAAAAKHHTAISAKLQRERRRSAAAMSPALWGLFARMGSIVSAGSREQPLRAQDQNDDHERVDDEGAKGRHVIFAGYVGDA